MVDTRRTKQNDPPQKSDAVNGENQLVVEGNQVNVENAKSTPSMVRVDSNYPDNSRETRLDRLEAEQRAIARALQRINNKLPDLGQDRYSNAASSYSRSHRTGEHRRDRERGVQPRYGRDDSEGYQTRHHRERPRSFDEGYTDQRHLGRYEVLPPRVPAHDRLGRRVDTEYESYDEPRHWRKNEREDRAPVARTTRQLARLVLDEDRGSPFQRWIVEAEPPGKFSMPKFKQFDGASDPTEHVRHFKQMMTFYHNNDPTMCKAFPASLGSVGMKWFSNLPPGRIGSFRELAERFTARFISNRPGPKDPSSLYAIRKKSGEKLRAYLNRFWELCQDIRGADLDMMLSAFKHGLPHDHGLYESLAKNPPMTADELTEKVEKYARIEDTKALKIHATGRAEVEEKTVKAEEETSKRKRPEDKGKGKAKAEPRSSSFKAVNTVFTEPIYRILKAIKDKPYFTDPRPMGGDPQARNQKLRCAYHKEKGHLTENCKTFKKYLEDLVEQGHLTEYIKHEDGEASPPPKRVTTTGNARIDAIHGLIRKEDASKRVLKTKQHRVMLAEQVVDKQEVVILPKKAVRAGQVVEVGFSDLDLAGVEVPHNDALVLTVNINTFDVARVLVDPGSSAEVMYLNLFNKLSLPASKIRKADLPIYGFSGQPVWPLGIVALPVRLGPVSKEVDFVIVDYDAPYNAILGRTWLGMMKAVASPFHQKLKFPCKEGVVEVRGSQYSARHTFAMAVQSSLTEARPQTDNNAEVAENVDNASGSSTKRTKQE